MTKYIYLFLLFLITLITIGGSQLTRPLPFTYSPDKYPGGVGEIFGSARVATPKSDVAGYIVVVPEVRLVEGNYEVFIEGLSSTGSNLTLELCSEDYLSGKRAELGSRDRSSRGEVLFGKHMGYLEKSAKLIKSCSNSLDVIKLATKSERTVWKYLFKITKDGEYRPFDLRLLYSGDGELQINRVILSPEVVPIRSSKLVRGLGFGLVVFITIAMFLFYLKVDSDEIKRVVLFCSPLSLISVYYIFHYINGYHYWTAGHLLACYLTILLFLFLSIFSGRNFLTKLKSSSRIIVFISLVLITSTVTYYDLLFSPKISFRVRTKADLILSLDFDYGKGEGLNRKSITLDNSSQVEILGSSEWQDITIPIPGNDVAHAYVSLLPIKGNQYVRDDVITKVELQRVKTYNILQVRENIGRTLYNALRPVSNIEIKESRQSVKILVSGRYGQIELGNNLIRLDTYGKNETIRYEYFAFILLFVGVAIYLYRRKTDTILEMLKTDGTAERSIIVLIPYLIFGITVLLSIGLPITSIYSQDLFTILDGLWRELNGVHTHSGYNSGVYGPLIFLPAYIGYLIDGHSSYILVYGNSFVFLMVTIFSWAVASKRLTIFGTLLFTAFVGLISIGYHVLGAGDGHNNITLAMGYNRYGYALISILSLLLLVPLRGTSERISKNSSVGIGLILSILLFLKLSYFFVAILLLLGSLFLFRWGKRESSYVAVSFFSLFIIVLAYLQFDFLSMFSDFRYIMGITGEDEGIITKIYEKLFNSFEEFFPLLLAAVPLVLNREYTIEERKSYLVFIGIMFLVGTLLLGSNFQFHESPIFLLALLILADRLLLKFIDRQDNQTFGMVFVMVAILTLVSGRETVIKHIYHVVYAYKNKQQRSYLNFDRGRYISAYLNDALVIDTLTTERFNNAFINVRPLLNSKSKLLSLSHNNSLQFSYKLLLPENLGFHFWHYNYNFNLLKHPKPSSLFKDVNLVIVRRKLTFLQRRLRMVYYDYIKKNFEFVDSYDHWVIYKRNNDE